MTFDAAAKCLVIALSSHKVLIYDVEAEALTARLPSLIAVPPSVMPRHERICGITALPDFPDKLILTGHNLLLTLDLGQLALRGEQLAGDGGEMPAKKKRSIQKSQDR